MSPSSETLTLESLLEYEPFVRKVLRNMLVEEDQLPDLVQETWVRVLKRPPTQRSGIRGWLATVARNLARDQKRTRGHRREREEAAARPEALETAQSSHERLEMHQALVQAVLELREPYKTVVVMRYYDGHSVADIAAQVGRSEATVRSQLHRAHLQLKERLDRQYGERREWMLIAVPWILVKEGVGSLGPAGGAESSVALPLIAGVLAASAALVALWAPWKYDESAVQAMEAGDGFTMERPLVEALALESSDVSFEPDAGQRAFLAAATPVGTPGMALPVRVQWNGLPVSGAAVWAYQPLLRTNDGYFSGASHADLERLKQVPARLLDMSRQRSQVVLTDLAGEALVPVERANTFLFAQHDEGFGVLTVLDVPQRMRSGERLQLQLDGDRGIHVQVRDPFGRPAIGVPVELLKVADPDGWEIVDCRATDPAGNVRFVGFRHLVGDHPFAVRTQVVGAENPILPAPADTHRQPIVLQTEPYGSLQWHWSGRQADEPWLGSAFLKTVGDAPATWTAVDFAHGQFPCVALHQTFELRLASTEAGSTGFWTGQGPVRHGSVAYATVQEPQGTVIEGRLVRPTEEGEDPLPAHRFDYRLQILNDQNQVASQVAFLPREDGRFRVTAAFAHDVAGPYHAEILSFWATPTGNQRVRIPLPPKPWNRVRTLDLGEVPVRMVTHSMLIHLVDERGEPLEGVIVEAQSDRHGPPVQAKSNAQGQVVLDGLWQPEVRVTVPPGQAAYLPEPFVWNGAAKPTAVTLQRTGALRGWVTVLDGEEPGEVLCSGEGDLANFRAKLACQPDGSFVLSGLRPGPYRLHRLGDEANEATRVYVFAGQIVDSGGLDAR